MKAKTFRSSMNGFNKEDVNAYIAEQNRQFSEAESDYKSTIARLQKELDERTEDTPDADELRAQLQQAEELIAAQNELAEQNRTLIDSQKETIRKLEDRCAAMQAKPTSAASGNDAYEQMRSELGGVMLDAHTRADEIVRTAQTQAQELLQAAKDEADKIRREAQAKREQDGDYIRLTVKKATMDCVNEYTARLNAVRSGIDSLLIDLRAASDHASARTASILDTAKSDIESAVGSEPQ